GGGRTDQHHAPIRRSTESCLSADRSVKNPFGDCYRLARHVLTREPLTEQGPLPDKQKSTRYPDCLSFHVEEAAGFRRAQRPDVDGVVLLFAAACGKHKMAPIGQKTRPAMRVLGPRRVQG